jgi:hypothetical protein
MAFHRRRWLQFQLGSLLVLAVLACVLFLLIRFAGFVALLTIGGLFLALLAAGIFMRVLPAMAIGKLQRLFGLQPPDEGKNSREKQPSRKS